MILTEVVKVVGVFIQVPVSVVVAVEAQRPQGAVPPVDDVETVRILGEVVVDDDVLIALWKHRPVVSEGEDHMFMIFFFFYHGRKFLLSSPP